MRYVLLTRTEQENIELAKQLQAKDINTFSFPLLNLIELPTDWQQIKKYSYIVVTSKFAARIVAKSILSPVKALVVGSESANILAQNPNISVQEVFLSVDALLAALMRCEVLANDMVYLSGSVVKRNLPGLIKRYIIYDTVYALKMPYQLVQMIKNMEIKALMLYSENSAKTFLNLCIQNDILSYARKIPAIVLSYDIKKVIDYDIEHILYCEKPYNNLMLELLYKLYAIPL
jgi:uroporphyrinogen-III synthase